MGKVLALGAVEEIKATFGDISKGRIEPTPVLATDLQYDGGTTVLLSRQTLVRSPTKAASLPSVGWKEIWRLARAKK
jgi:hypothetical protein